MLKLSKLQILRLQIHQNLISRKMSVGGKLPNFHTVLKSIIILFLDQLNGYRPQSKVPSNSKGGTFIPPANVKLPKSVDWRKLGAVTKVKKQGACGSCWAFSATGALEGQHFRKTGKLVSLSEQNLIDCSHDFGNDGCHGGEVDAAFQYIKWQKGIDTEAAYPYKGYEIDPRKSRCHFKKEDIGATDVGYVNIKYADEEALKAAVATIGPISAAIYVNEWTWPFFHEGM